MNPLKSFFSLFKTSGKTKRRRSRRVIKKKMLKTLKHRGGKQMQRGGWGGSPALQPTPMNPTPMR